MNSDVTENTCPELPSVKTYQELENNHEFQNIKLQFLYDITELKQLACNYVGQQYSPAIETFIDNISFPPDHHKESLLPIYQDVRPYIHEMVQQLKSSLEAEECDPQGGQGEYIKEHIASVLHECLSDIDLCPAGVHSRFTATFLSMNTTQDGLDKTLHKTRHDLFSAYVKSFLFQKKREGAIDIPSGMDVHWFNSFYNLFCKSLALAPIEDPLAPPNPSASLTRLFLSEVTLHINNGNVLRHLVDGWYDKISATLHQLGVSSWLTDVIEASEITAEIAEKLNSTVFRPVNLLLGARAADRQLNLWTVIDEQKDGSYRLHRSREKLLAYAASHFFGSTATVFATLPDRSASKMYIGTINKVFYWVFQCDRTLHTGHSFTFEPDNLISLQLSHLASLDISNWPKITTQLLLTQAMTQTGGVDDIASFFVDKRVMEQLKQTPEPIIRMLSNQLEEKLLRNGRFYRDELRRKICDHLTSTSRKTAPIASLRLLTETSLLEPVLCTLKHCSKNITEITDQLDAWQIADFSAESIKTILTAKNCQALFRQAVRNLRGRTLSHLLLTGHCDMLTAHLSSRRLSPLSIIAGHGVLPGLKYLLGCENRQVNHTDDFGYSPLHYAAEYGRLECIEELLKADDIQINKKGNKDWTPLHHAIWFGHSQSVQALLKAEGIRVNEKSIDGWTPLHLAARNGDMGSFLELLKTEGIKVNEQNSDGWTPLHIAANAGNPLCIRELLRAESIDPNKQDNEGCTPLIPAIKSNHIDSVRELLAAVNTEVNLCDNYGTFPLHHATIYGQHECVQLLLGKPGIAVNKKDSKGRTPLATATSLGRHQCIRELLKAPEILVNEQDRDGWTPLIIAVVCGLHKCIQTLLEAEGIEVNRKDNSGSTALHKAILCSAHDVIGGLSRDDGSFIDEHHNRYPPGRAVTNSRHECLRELIRAKGINVNCKNKFGQTPLNAAARLGYSDCIRELMKAPEIQVNEKHNSGWTPLHSAARYGHHDSIRELLASSDINVNEKNGDQWTPLHYAARHGHHECIRELLKTGDIRVNEKNSDQWAPLHCAARYGHHECIRELVTARGIRVNEKNNEGWTPLHYAAGNGHTESVRTLLLSENIRINETNNDNWTALGCAACHGHPDSIRELVKAEGIDVNKRSRDGWTPLSSAARNGHHHCIRELLNAKSIQVHCENIDGLTALEIAYKCDRRECAQELLKKQRI